MLTSGLSTDSGMTSGPMELSSSLKKDYLGNFGVELTDLLDGGGCVYPTLPGIWRRVYSRDTFEYLKPSH